MSEYYHKIGRSIGTGVTAVGNRGASRSWTPQNPLGGETPSFWYQEGTRNDLILPNSVTPGTNDATIALPYLYKPTGDEYARIVDNGAFDVGADDFTLALWAKSEDATKTAFRGIAGKYVAGNVVGRYGFLQNTTTGNAVAIIQSTTTSYTIDSGIDHTDGQWRFLRMDVNQATKKFRFFVNEIQIGADVSFLGTFSAMAAYTFFAIGTGIYADGSGNPRYPDKGSYSDCYIYRRLLTPEEGATLMARGNVAGAFFYTDCVLRQDNIVLDLSGNGNHLTGVNLLMATKKKYGAAGSKQAINIGYSLYENFPSKEVQVPFTQSGAALTGYTPSGYTKTADVNGSATDYNLADSQVNINGVDRSDTTECSYIARFTELQHYYDASNVSGIHAAELTNLILSNYFTDAYRGLRFVKRQDKKLTDLLIYSTNKTGADYEKIIKWTGERGLLKFDTIVVGHICAVSGAKMLQFDDIDTLSLSFDYGATYPITKVLTGVSKINHALFFDNGNIMFCDDTKVYYSDDNLTTYQESNVIGIDGNPFVPSTVQNFRPWDCDRAEVTHDGLKLHTWGSYINSGTGEYVNINQWYTTDQGVTIKSGYKFGVSLPDVDCTHIHYVKYDSYSDTFWMGTGDNNPGHNNLMRGTYDSSTDTWTWEVLGSGAAYSIWENSDLGFDEDYIYFTGELAIPYKGLRRSLRSDIANIETNQERIFLVDEYSLAIYIDSDYYIHCEGCNTTTKASSHIKFSMDGIRYVSRQFNEIDILGVAFGGLHCVGKMSNGYYLFQALSSGETIIDYHGGEYLLIKPTEIK